MNAIQKLDVKSSTEISNVKAQFSLIAVVDLLTCALNEARKVNDKEIQYFINMALIASREKSLR
jgi:hypothetical protein